MKIFGLENLKNILNCIAPAHIAGVDVCGICIAKNLKRNHLCFIKGVGPLNDVQSFLSEAQEIPEAVIFIIDEKFYESKKSQMDFIDVKNIILTSNLDFVMCELSKHFYQKKYKDRTYQLDGRKSGKVQICPSSRLAPNVFVGENVEIGENVIIMPGCVIMGDSRIGSDTILYPNVVIYPETELGKSCIIHANSAIGSDGFGYNFLDGEHKKIWHIGGVKIGDKVEIGTACTIDRGTFDNTIIESGSKLDNSVHIAHNCHLKSGVVVCAQSGLAGSVTVGSNTAMSGHVAIAPGVKIGDQCEIVGHSAVFENFDNKSRIAGYPAKPMKQWLRQVSAIRRLIKK